MVRQIKGIEESTLEVDFSVPFTRNCYVIYLLKWNLKLFFYYFGFLKSRCQNLGKYGLAEAAAKLSRNK